MQHRYVAVIPNNLQEGVLYICEKYGTLAHKCCCGCGSEINTPLSPTDWRLIKNGTTVSLYPSIGNWALPCQSHYWIRNNQVIWAEQWSLDEINAGRLIDRKMKRRFYEDQNRVTRRISKSNEHISVTDITVKLSTTVWQKLEKWFS